MRDDERQEPLADLPCDAPGCDKPWKHRMFVNGDPEPTYACEQHYGEIFGTKREARS